ncbi:MAG: type IV pilus twitching motility protein PilT [Planctomycetota bacterium]|jgi:twitching motility protein PilT
MPDIDRYLRHMVETGASDFHLTTRSRPMYRVDGDMVESTDLSSERFSENEVAAMLSAIAPENRWREFEESGDTDFAYAVQELGRFRVNVFRNTHGIGGVLRHIPAHIMGFDELGLPDTVRELCALEKGLVLVTGPTGCGKSTTLAAMVDHMNGTRRDHIVTIEDPVEFMHEPRLCHINHREVGPHTRSFRHALRAALRQDPDIVLVGEMRDLETTEIAIETAETGHLVLGTLHTSTAASTVDRVIDQFPAERQAQIRAMLAVSLKGVLCQTLLRRADGKGRVAALEIMAVTSGVANLIREGKTHQIPSAIQTGRREGMQLLNDDLMALVRDETVHPAEAYRKAIDKSDLAERLEAEGFDRTSEPEEPKPEVEDEEGEVDEVDMENGGGNGNGNGDPALSGTTVYVADSAYDARSVAGYLKTAGVEIVLDMEPVTSSSDGRPKPEISVADPADVDRALDLLARRNEAFGGG